MISHIFHSDLKDMWEMWFINASSELKKWNRVQKDGLTAPERTDVTRGLTEGYIEEVLLKE